ITDTVGFIRKLPHHLVASFHSTLTEAVEADLLLHVVDASAPDFRGQMSAVEVVLEKLLDHPRPTVMVFNKSDRLGDATEAAGLRAEFPGAFVVSAHAYAFLGDRYAVLSCGASMGMGYGPVMVAKSARTPESLRGRRVAIPGALTTAALLLTIECPGAIPVETVFHRIPDAVAEGEVDAGVIIHESQLTYGEQGLVKVLDFGELWRERDSLPVPLGLDVVRRDLGAEMMRAVSDGFRASIQAALDHEREALDYAL